MNVLRAYAQEALAALWRNRGRSALTMLGMIVGSASIIAVFGISKAATSGIASTFASFGQLPVYVAVDTSQDYPDRAAMQYRDAASVGAALGSLAASVQPSWQRTYTVSAGNVRADESVYSDGGYHDDSLALSGGREIDDADVSSAASVCVMTADLARRFFGSTNAVGSFLRVNGERFRVVGVYADIKGSFLNSLISNTSVVIPYTTFYRDFSPGVLDFLIVYPSDPRDADAVGKATIAELRHIHGQQATYQVQNGAGFVSAFDGVLNVVGIGLSAIGGVALLVAGIGIMNIMLVSVTERTREIGIRKAIGASCGSIVLQFLMESVMLSVIGGGVGMLLGIIATVGTASLLSRQLGALVVPYLLIVAIALGFSIAVGAVFGTYPAVRASALDPIEALRS